MTHPLVPTALQCSHARTVRDGSSSYKIDNVIVIKNFLNPEGHQNPISGSIITAILLKGWIFPIGGASAGERLGLQPAQQACLINLCSDSLCDLFPPTALRRHYAQTVWDSSSNYNRLFPTRSKGLAILLDGGDFAYWWSCIGKGLRLQPLHCADCFKILPKIMHKQDCYRNTHMCVRFSPKYIYI